MQFLTTCLQCGQSIRKNVGTCPVCGQPANLRPLDDNPDLLRYGRERITWGVLAGIWLENAGYGFGFCVVTEILLFSGLVTQRWGIPILGGLTGVALLMIGVGRWMRHSLQGMPDLGFSAWATFLLRRYPYPLMSLLMGLALGWLGWNFFILLDNDGTERAAAWFGLSVILAFIFDSPYRTLTAKP